MDEIRVGIIGFGFMGRAHTYGYKTIPLYYNNLPFKIRLVGICDTVPGVAEKAKEQLGFEFATTNPDDIFNSPDIDVIDICTPNIYHKDGIVKALAGGKNVYCDKPLAASYEEAKEVLELVKKYDKITQMALQYRFYPGTLRIKELLDEGKIGKIMSFRTAYLHASAVDPNKAIGWKQDKKMGGGGVLFDLGSHALDVMYHLLGEYDSVFANTDIIYKQRPDKNGNMIDIEADDLALMLLKLKQGGTGVVEASKIATGVQDEMRIEIHGSKGSVKYNSMDPNYVDFYDNTVPEGAYGGNKGYTRIECVHRYPAPGGQFPGPKFAIGFMRGHVHSLYNFISNVYAGKKSSPSFEEGAYIQYVMEKAYESADKGQWIQL